jgi:hypothetical protein
MPMKSIRFTYSGIKMKDGIELIIWDGVVMVVGEFNVIVSSGGEFFDVNVSLLNASPTVVCRQ